MVEDRVHIHNCKDERELFGQGTGDARVHLDLLKEANTKIFVSVMSAKACGYDESLLEGYNAEYSVPECLINSLLEAEGVFCYKIKKLLR